MRRDRTVVCPSCHARWDADRARFCGWCGVALRPVEPSDTDPRPQGPWRRRLMRVGAAAAAVAALLVTVSLVDDLRLPGSRPDSAVELADDGDAVVPRGEALSDTERAELLAPFDPDRLRCEPDGCEVWRIDRVAASDAEGSLEAALLGDLVVTSVGDDIVAYDHATGGERWRQDWPRIDGRPATGWTIMLAAAGGERVVLARPESGHLVALTPDGEIAWADHEPRPMQNFIVTGDALVTSHLERPGRRTGGTDDEVTFPSEQVVLRDLATGDRRWERPGLALMGAASDVVVAREGGDTLVLDAASGDEHGRLALPDDAWLYPVGEVLIHFGEGDTSVVDRSFKPVPGLEDLSEVGPVLEDPWTRTSSTSDPGLILGIRRHADASLPTEVVLADGRGTILWSVDVPASEGFPQNCCPNVHLAGDAVVVPVERGEPDGPGSLRLGLEDGTVLPPAEEPPVPSGPDTWMLAADVAVEQYADGVRLHRRDGTVEVQGGGWPLGGGEPYVFGNGRSLLAVRVIDGE